MISSTCERCGAEAFALSTLDRAPVCAECFRREAAIAGVAQSLEVLLVERDDTFAAAVERHLRGAGHHVVRATSSSAALAALAGGRHDVVVTDGDLDQAGEGFALLAQIAPRWPELKRILYTTRGVDDALATQVAHVVLPKEASPAPLLRALAA